MFHDFFFQEREQFASIRTRAAHEVNGSTQKAAFLYNVGVLPAITTGRSEIERSPAYVMKQRN